LISRLTERHSDILDSNRPRLVEWLGLAVDRALDQGDFSGALNVLAALRKLDREHAGDKKTEMVLLWAHHEREEGRYESALRIYVEQLMAVSPHIARDRISVALEEAERAYRGSGELGRAIDLYESYGLRHDPERSRERLAALWREFGWAFLRRGEIEEARKIFTRGEKLLPGSTARDLNFCDYHEQRVRLASTDYPGHYRLGEWCLQRDLIEEAREAFEIAMLSETLRPYIWSQIQRINNEQAEAELHRLLDLYEQGRYIEALEGAMEFRTRPVGEGLLGQARDLEQLTRTAIEIAASERPQQAEVLAQQAERAFFTGDALGAYSLVQTLMERYEDTPAAARAAQLYRLIKVRLDINQLETRRRLAADAEQKDWERDLAPSQTALADEIRRLRASIEPSPGDRPPDAESPSLP
jgi:tetratricopeptide (TPR) repeat protein